MCNIGLRLEHINFIQMKHTVKIAPSMLSSDFANLQKEIEKCNTDAILGLSYSF